MAAKSRRDHIVAASEARSNLNIFAGVIALLEGGTVVGAGAYAASEKIIAACKAETQRQLRAYDRAIAAAVKDPAQ